MVKRQPSKKEEIAMSNKKFSKLLVLSAMGLLTLTACSSTSEIVAKPSTYKDDIVTIEGKDDIQNNVLSVIYDALHDGSIDNEVFSKIMFKYSESVFGTYNRVTAKDEETITLEEAAADASADGGYVKINAFIKAHKVYWFYNDEGKHVSDENPDVEVDDDTFVPCQTERDNVVAKYKAVEKRIAELMYAKISGGSYTEKHFFDELKFVKSLYEAGDNVGYEAAKADRNNGDLPKVIVDYKIEKEDVFNENILHKKYYQNGSTLDYVEKKVIPDVYGDLLIEQYLLDEELASVRNSRARKINVIKIEKYSGFTNNADALVNDLVNQIYGNLPDALAEHVETDVKTIEDYYDSLFDVYATVSKGLYKDIQNEARALEIIDRLHAIASDVYKLEDEGEDNPYYLHTTYGDLVEDYNDFLKTKAYDDYDNLDMTLYNKFTSNGTVLPEEGFDQEVISIDQSKSITKGWYIQNSAPSLDSNGEITDRLFKLSVANDKIEVGKVSDGVAQETIDKAIEKLSVVDRVQKVNGVWSVRETPDTSENKYLCSINGAYFLKFDGQYAKDDYKKDIVYDDGSAYYIVQVLEAVKDVKLRNKLSDNSYANTRGSEFLNEVINTVTTLIGETGNYASLSKEYWLEKMNIKYHDQKVYDYFKANYPDLFD